jgi:hypothetical protein
MSITLQRAQATSILKYIVGVGEGSSKLITLSIFIPFFFYMLLVTSEGFGTQSVPLPLYDSLWVKVFFWLRLQSFVFVVFSPLCWVLSLMEFARVSSSILTICMSVWEGEFHSISLLQLHI